MGQSLFKNTSVDKESMGNTGTGAQWKMYNGHRIDKSKQQITAFIFETKAISKLTASSKEDYLTNLKKEPQMLAKYKHPGIISLMDPLIENPKALGFTTERLQGSLHSFIQQNRITEIFASELDTKFHLLELVDTIQFMHNDIRTVHLQISPENIYIAQDGKWKLGGFTFATQIMQSTMASTPLEFASMGGEVRLTPSLKFSAPEVADNPSQCCYNSDMFSFACLIYTLYKINKDQRCDQPYLFNSSTVSAHNQNIKNLSKIDMSCIPDGLKPLIQRMLNPDPTLRLSINEFVNCAYFKDPFIQTVRHLDNLYTKDFAAQQNFLKGLNRIITKFEPRFLKNRVMPLLLNLMKNEQLAASILPVFFTIMQSKEHMSKLNFQDQIWGPIKGLITGKEIPAQALYLLLQNTELLIEHIQMSEFSKVFIPLMAKSFECGVQKLQVCAIEKVQIFYQKIDYNVLKSQIVPRVLMLCTDANIEVRKSSILLLAKIYPILDKHLINDQVLTTLEKVRKLTNNYKINMTILEIFEGISGTLGIDTIANKIMCTMVPMLVDRNLSKAEYKAYLSTVKTFMTKIETEQDKFYSDKSDAIPEDDKSSLDPTRTTSQNTSNFAGGEGEFGFLDPMGGGGGQSQQKQQEFDLSTFDKIASGNTNPTASTGGFDFGGSASTSNQTASKGNDGWGNFDFGGGSSNKQSNTTTGSDPFGFGSTSNNNTTTSTQQSNQKSGQTPFSNKSVTEKKSNAGQSTGGLSKIGNPWGNQKSSNAGASNDLGSVNFGSGGNTGSQSNDMFGGLKVNSSGNSSNNNQGFGGFGNNTNKNTGNANTGKSGWDFEIDVNQNSNSGNNNAAAGGNPFDTYGSGNTNNSNNNQGFGGFSGGGNSNTNKNTGGGNYTSWDNMNIDLGGGSGNNNSNTSGDGFDFGSGSGSNNNNQGGFGFGGGSSNTNNNSNQGFGFGNSNNNSSNNNQGFGNNNSGFGGQNNNSWGNNNNSNSGFNFGGSNNNNNNNSNSGWGNFGGGGNKSNNDDDFFAGIGNNQKNNQSNNNFVINKNRNFNNQDDSLI